MAEKTAKRIFVREKETKNAVRFEEKLTAGEPKIINFLYLQKFFCGDAQEVEAVVTIK